MRPKSIVFLAVVVIGGVLLWPLPVTQRLVNPRVIVNPYVDAASNTSAPASTWTPSNWPTWMLIGSAIAGVLIVMRRVLRRLSSPIADPPLVYHVPTGVVARSDENQDDPPPLS